MTRNTINRFTGPTVLQPIRSHEWRVWRDLRESNSVIRVLTLEGLGKHMGAKLEVTGFGLEKW